MKFSLVFALALCLCPIFSSNAQADIACAVAQQALNCPSWTAFQGSPEQGVYVDFTCYANVCSSVTQTVISTGSHDNLGALCSCDNVATDNGQSGAPQSCVQSAVLSFCSSGY